jgi:hypothetical protein
MAWRDNDGSSSVDRAQARELQRETRDSLREARQELREIVDRLERPERDVRNPYGLGLDDRGPRQDHFGLSLLDQGQRDYFDQLIRDTDAMANRLSERDRFSRRTESEGPKASAGQIGYVSCSAGPALGPAPSVALDGTNDWSAPLNWNLAQYSPTFTITPEYQIGRAKAADGSFQTVLSGDLGINGPMGSGRLSVGMSYNVSDPERSRLYGQGRVLGMSCQVGVDVGRVSDAMQRRFYEAAERYAPSAQRVLSPLGLPSSP